MSISQGSARLISNITAKVKEREKEIAAAGAVAADAQSTDARSNLWSDQKHWQKEPSKEKELRKLEQKKLRKKTRAKKLRKLEQKWKDSSTWNDVEHLAQSLDPFMVPEQRKGKMLLKPSMQRWHSPKAIKRVAHRWQRV
jgi:hypothetical protein